MLTSVVVAIVVDRGPVARYVGANDESLVVELKVAVVPEDCASVHLAAPAVPHVDFRCLS